MSGLERVIFIAGADWSGSTMIGCVLGANLTSPFECFHIGEAHAFFTEDHPKFGDAKDANEHTSVWRQMDHRVGPTGAYEEIARKAGSSVIVDSSKNLRWLECQVSVCERMAIPLDIVVTFRAFQAFLHSAERKHGEAKVGLQKLSYYQRLLEYTRSIHSINTETFASDSVKSTKRLCEFLRVPYFPEKSEYWRFPLFHLYGSRSQRQHLYKPDSGGYRSSLSTPHRLSGMIDASGLHEVEQYLWSRDILGSGPIKSGWKRI